MKSEREAKLIEALRRLTTAVGVLKLPEVNAAVALAHAAAVAVLKEVET